MPTISIRFATDDVRDLSDGQLPVEVWVVRTGSGKTTERHFATATKRHRVAYQVRRAARGLSFDSVKHVELRTPKARQEAPNANP